MRAQAATVGRDGHAAGEHRWVGAALVDLGRSRVGARVEHAARTGRHVLPAGTRVQVLEVYCAWCRVAPDSRAAGLPCVGSRAVVVRPLRDPAA